MLQFMSLCMHENNQKQMHHSGASFSASHMQPNLQRTRSLICSAHAASFAVHTQPHLQCTRSLTCSAHAASFAVHTQPHLQCTCSLQSHPTCTSSSEATFANWSNLCRQQICIQIPILTQAYIRTHTHTRTNSQMFDALIATLRNTSRMHDQPYTSSKRTLPCTDKRGPCSVKCDI